MFMLKINDKKYNILSSEIKFVDATHNKTKGYSILLSIDISLNDIKGYISFYVDFFSNKDYKNIENKKYIDIPTELNSKISLMEIYDTKNFIDFIDSEVIVEFGKIEDKKIEMNLLLNDKLILLEYNDILDLR